MIHKILPLFLSVCLTINASAKKNVSQQLTLTLEQFRNAMISGDSSSLADLTLPELSYGHSGGHIDDRHEFIDKLASGKSDFVTITLSDESMTILNDVAIVRHNMKATTNDNGVAGTVNLHVMLVWKHQKTGWKLLARQAVKIK